MIMLENAAWFNGFKMEGVPDPDLNLRTIQTSDPGQLQILLMDIVGGCGNQSHTSSPVEDHQAKKPSSSDVTSDVNRVVNPNWKRNF